MIREELLKTNKDHWETMAKKHVSLMFEHDIERVQELAKG